MQIRRAFACLAIGFVIQIVQAAPLVSPASVAGTEGNSQANVPFDVDSAAPPSTRYQQVYAASDFGTAPLTITRLIFRPNSSQTSPLIETITNIQINLSTTAKAPDGLDATFANNVGADNTIVWSGPLTLSTSATGPAGGPRGFDIVINLTTQFPYNPANGNLLLDVKNFTGGDLGATTFFFDAQDTSGDSISRRYGPVASATSGVVDSKGLVTQFLVQPTVASQSSSTGILGVAPGSSVTDTATVTGITGMSTPTGTVTFLLCPPSQVTAGSGCGASGTSVAAGDLGAGDSYQGVATLLGDAGAGNHVSLALSFTIAGAQAFRLVQFRFAANWSAGINSVNAGFYEGADLNTATLLESFTFSAAAQSIAQLFTAVSATHPLLLPGHTYFVALWVDPTSTWGWQSNNTSQVDYWSRFDTGAWMPVLNAPTPAFDVSGTPVGFQVGTAKTLDAGAHATSDASTNTAALGTYCWLAVYSGDNLYSPRGHTDGTSECFTVIPPSLDIDASVAATKYDAVTDGLLIVRYLQGLTGGALVAGALGPTAARTDPAAVKTWLDAIRPQLDIDGNGSADPFTDGVLIIRYMMGLRGDALIANAVDLQNGSRKTAPDIEAWIQSLMP